MNLIMHLDIENRSRFKKLSEILNIQLLAEKSLNKKIEKVLVRTQPHRSKIYRRAEKRRE